MLRSGRVVSVFVLVLGLACVGIGIGFVAQSAAKTSWIKQQMQSENITLGLTPEQIAAGEMVDSAGEAQKAADTIREHRHTNFGTYNEVLGGKPFNPSDPRQVSYMQALNLENYLYLSVAGFGVATVVLGAGVFMILAGIALGLAGWTLFRRAGTG